MLYWSKYPPSFKYSKYVLSLSTTLQNVLCKNIKESSLLCGLPLTYKNIRHHHDLSLKNFKRLLSPMFDLYEKLKY